MREHNPHIAPVDVDFVLRLVPCDGQCFRGLIENRPIAFLQFSVNDFDPTEIETADFAFHARAATTFGNVSPESNLDAADLPQFFCDPGSPAWVSAQGEHSVFLLT
jgi:hypothetical protein